MHFVSSEKSSFSEWMTGSATSPASIRTLTILQRCLQISLFVIAMLASFAVMTPSATVATGLCLVGLSVVCIALRAKLSPLNKPYDRADVVITITSAIATAILTIIILAGAVPATAMAVCMIFPFLGLTASMASNLLRLK